MGRIGERFRFNLDLDAVSVSPKGEAIAIGPVAIVWWTWKKVVPGAERVSEFGQIGGEVFIRASQHHLNTVASEAVIRETMVREAVVREAVVREAVVREAVGCGRNHVDNRCQGGVMQPMVRWRWQTRPAVRRPYQLLSSDEPSDAKTRR